jgi:hypothetical protein
MKMASSNLAAQQPTYSDLIFWYFQLAIIYLVNDIMRVPSFHCAADRLKQRKVSATSWYFLVPLVAN